MAFALQHAAEASAALFVSHGIAVGLLMYMDLSGRWDAYRLFKNRKSSSAADYFKGWKSFCVDLVTLFLPCTAFCLYHSADAIFVQAQQDTWWESAFKFLAGYMMGKTWAFGVHYILHIPCLYQFHKRHHPNPKDLVGSQAWQDSFVEYAIMELPSFCLALLCFPTKWAVHLLHFALHGLDGAAGHSGFKAPGILGFLFDGEYHYYHHAYLTVNYAEVEIIDKLFGTHHSQQARFAKKHEEKLCRAQ